MKKNDDLASIIQLARIRSTIILQSVASPPPRCDSEYAECPYCISHNLLGAITSLQHLAIDLAESFDRLHVPISNGKR